MVNILGFDTSTGPASVAVWKNGHIAAYFEDLGKSTQSASLMPMVEKALRQSRLAYQDLTAVACTIGPGSFTGIRVGLSAARAIALAAGIKGMGFSTLEVIAFAARQSAQPVLAALGAGKGELYYQGFDAPPKWKPRFSARTGTPEAARSAMEGDFITVGNAVFPGILSMPVTFPRADALCELAAAGAAEAHGLAPLYIRPPDAKPMADVG